MELSSNEKRLIYLLWIGIVVCLYFHLLYISPCQDEGWYLYAAKGVVEGRFPFIHSFYTQGPLTPFIMAPAAFFGSPLIAGRIQASLFFIASLLLGSYWLWKEKHQAGIIWWLALVGFSSSVVNVSVLPMTTGYEIFFIMLTVVLFQQKRLKLAVAIAALSITIRISMMPWAFAVWLAAIYASPKEKRLTGALKLLSAGIIPVALVMLPFIIISPRGLWNGLFQYHLSGGRMIISSSSAWAYRWFFWKEWPHTFAPILITALIALLLSLKKLRLDIYDGLFFVASILLSVGHTMAAMPQPKYQIGVCMLLALFASRRLAVIGMPLILKTAAVCILIYFGFSLFWLKQFHDSWDDSSIFYIGKAGEYVSEMAAGEPVLTFNSLLAVEGDLSVPPNYEMGPFSLTVSISDDQAKSMGTVTPSMLLDHIENRKYRAIAIHKDDLGLTPEDIRQRTAAALFSNYTMVKTFDRPPFRNSPCYLFVRKKQDN